MSSWKDVGENKDGEVVLTPALISIATGQFDITIITRLSLTRLGIPTITKCLSQCSGLIELDLSYNHLLSTSGLDALPSLTRVDLRCNKIRSLRGLAPLSRLEVARLQGNCVDTLDELGHMRGLPVLRGLYLRDKDGTSANPVCSSDKYVSTMCSWFDRVRCIDGHYFNKEDMNPRTIGLGDDEEFVLPRSEPWIVENFFKTAQWDPNKAGIAAERAFLNQIAEAKKFAAAASPVAK